LRRSARADMEMRECNVNQWWTLCGHHVQMWTPERGEVDLHPKCHHTSRV